MKLDRATLQSVDAVARTAIVAPYGSEGAYLSAELADSVNARLLSTGDAVLLGTNEAGERFLLGSLGHDPAGGPGSGVWAAATNGGSVSYSDGSTFFDVGAATIAPSAPCSLLCTAQCPGYSNVVATTGVPDVRLQLCDGGGAPLTSGVAYNYGQAAANTRMLFLVLDTFAVTSAGTYIVKYQMRTRTNPSTVTYFNGRIAVWGY